MLESIDHRCAERGLRRSLDELDIPLARASSRADVKATILTRMFASVSALMAHNERSRVSEPRCLTHPISTTTSRTLLALASGNCHHTTRTAGGFELEVRVMFARLTQARPRRSLSAKSLGIPIQTSPNRIVMGDRYASVLRAVPLGSSYCRIGDVSDKLSNYGWCWLHRFSPC